MVLKRGSGAKFSLRKRNDFAEKKSYYKTEAEKFCGKRGSDKKFNQKKTKKPKKTFKIRRKTRKRN